MKKVVWYIFLVIVLLSVSAGTVMAGQGRGGGGGGAAAAPKGGCVFALVGEVTALDTETQSLTVQVMTGNRLVQDCIDTDLLVTTTLETRFRRYGDPETVFIEFGDVELGDYVSIGGCVVAVEAEDDCFVAERVTVDVPVECLPLP